MMPTITSSWSMEITELGIAVTMAERAGEEGAGHTGAQSCNPSWGKKKWKKERENNKNGMDSSRNADSA